jgi:Protein of unknown function (DUF1579)
MAGELLQAFVGEWRGTNKTWFQPDVLADESPIEGSIRMLPGSGFVIYRFNILAGRFDSTRLDTYHMTTYMMVSEGPGTAPRQLSKFGEMKGGGILMRVR